MKKFLSIIFASVCIVSIAASQQTGTITVRKPRKAKVVGIDKEFLAGNQKYFNEKVPRMKELGENDALLVKIIEQSLNERNLDSRSLEFVWGVDQRRIISAFNFEGNTDLFPVKKLLHEFLAESIDSAYIYGNSFVYIIRIEYTVADQ